MKILGISIDKLFRFAAGGVLSSAVTLGVTALLHEIFDIRESIAAAGGLGAALVVNFLFLRYVVFTSGEAPIVRQITMFLASTGVFRGIEYLGFLIVNGVLGVHYLIALVLVLSSSFLLKFLVYERFVFARGKAATIREEPR